MKVNEFLQKAELAFNSKTLYIKGCFGAPMGYGSNRTRYSTNNTYNKKRASLIMATSDDTFGFDCICLLKGCMGGWSGKLNAVYGGTIVNNEKEAYKKGQFPTELSYGTERVPDYGENKMITVCTNVSEDFSNIIPGEMLWKDGHAGIYIGNGLAIECTPSWADGVQKTAVSNIGTKKGYNSRKWTKHGKLPWIDYSAVAPQPTPSPTPAPTPTATTPNPPMPKLQQGSTGKAVKVWQVIVGATVDGVFGKNTRQATISFQAKAFPGQPSEWDGIVGNHTWTKGLQSLS